MYHAATGSVNVVARTVQTGPPAPSIQQLTNLPIPIYVPKRSNSGTAGACLKQFFARVRLLLAALALFLCPGIFRSQEQPRTFRIPFHTVNGLILLDATLKGKFAVLLTLALAIPMWILCGIARVVRSEEFRREMERLREQQRRKRGKFLSLLLVP